jgi:hypothetical protein
VTVRRLFGVALGLVGLLLGSGCGASSSAGPLGTVPPNATIGAPGPVVAIGTDIFTNDTSAPITTDSAALSQPVRLKLVTAFILPLHGKTSFGTAHYPVPKHYLQGVDWSARHVVAGAVVLPKEQVEVVAVVRMTSRRMGTAKAVTVSYSQNGHHYARYGPDAVNVQLGT